MDGVRTSEQTPTPPPPEDRPQEDALQNLIRYEGPPEQFLTKLLALQCHLVRADGGAILRAGQSDRPDVLAVHPPPEPGQAPPDWLTQTAEQMPAALARGQGAILPVQDSDALYGQPARRHVILLPLRSESGPSGAAAFCVGATDVRLLHDLQRRLELTTALLSLYEVRLTLQRRQVDFRRLRSGLEILASVHEHDRFQASAMALCNEVASRHQCDRVSLGFHKGRYVVLKAMSNTEKFSRKMKLVQDIEAAMEECFDQDLEVFHPAPEEIAFVSRSAKELSVRHGPTAVLSIPLRREGEAIAVLTLERPIDRPFGPQEIETLRLTGELVTPRLANLHKTDRWVGARAAAGLRKGLAAAVGPKHTWLKLLSVAVLAAVLFLVFGKGTFRAEAPCVIQAVQLRVLPAPYDGYVAEAGDWRSKAVAKGDVLAKLDIKDLDLQLEEARAQYDRHRKEADTAQREGKTAEMKIAQAQMNEVQAKINLLEERKAKAEIVSPVTGHVISGDLSSQLGAPVKTGDKLYEIVPLWPHMVDLTLPGEVPPALSEGARGTIVFLDHTDASPVPYEVRRVERPDPAAKAHRVRLQLLERHKKAPLGLGRTYQARLTDKKAGTLGEYSVRPVSPLQAELAVPEDLIADVKVGMAGELATASYPGTKVPFVVDRINPRAEMVDERNVFKVRVLFTDEKLPDWMRPGMEGIGKIEIGERTYGYIWTRRLVNWVRMKLWW